MSLPACWTSVRKPVVSDPTTTSAKRQRSRACMPPTGARPVRLTSQAEPTREAHR